MQENTTGHKVARHWTDFDRILGGAWSEQVLEDCLRVITEGVCELAGFGVASISVVRDSHHLETVVVTGDDDAERALLGHVWTLSELDAAISTSKDWGGLRYVPHGAPSLVEDTAWTPEYTPIDHPDAWQPDDLLFAPLLNDDDVLCGVLAVDLPTSGLRPGAEQQTSLRRYVALATRLIGALTERAHAAEQVRLAVAARRVVRVASEQLSIARILETSGSALLEGFRIQGMWIHAFDDLGHGRGAIFSSTGQEVQLPAALVEHSTVTARAAWRDQRVEVLCETNPAPPTLTATQYEQVLEFFHTLRVASALFVPLGSGDECLGNLVMTRNNIDDEWTGIECAAALDIGHDLGQAVFNARTFERERTLLEEVKALESYKSQLIATVSHEFKNPLTVILGHLELIEGNDVDPEVRRSLNVITRSANKLDALATDLLVLSHSSDPNRLVKRQPVDLTALVHGYIEVNALEAARRDLQIVLHAPEGPVLAVGEAVELERVCVNLIGNAVKYSREGGTITITLSASSARATLIVADDGLGMSTEDQSRIFTEFFRSSNPVALEQPGTGLGLAIVNRIIQRHGGTIDLTSALGEGTTFTVSLPVD